MHTRYCVGSGALIAALLTSTASFADVSPQDVWDNWRSYTESYGYEITASESMSGGTLSVTDLSMRLTMPDGAGIVDAAFGDLSFADQGDGTVRVELPAVMPIALHIAPLDEEPVNVSMETGLTGFSMVASGTPEAMSFAYTASEVSVKLVELVVDGEPVGTARFQLLMSNLIGSSATKIDDLRAISQLMQVAAMSYDIGVADPAGSGSFFFKGEVADLQMAAESTMPENVDLENMNAALKAGFAIDTTISYGAGSSEFSFTDGSDSGSGSSTSQSGNLDMSMGGDQMSYGGSTKGFSLSLMGFGIPFPMNMALAEGTFDMSMPVGQSDTPQDFSLLVKLIDLAPDEMIWGMLDPGRVLPHDPATLVLSLAGKANWLFDIMDPDQAEAMAMETPAELHALNLRKLRLSVAGAELTGAGDFTFNNDDLQTFDGMPAPDGAIDLKLVGANGLMDKLIAMGIMSQDDAMGMRMMMGLFGRVGDGEDTLLSTIEVKANGQITANGQRLQ